MCKFCEKSEIIGFDDINDTGRFQRDDLTTSAGATITGNQLILDVTASYVTAADRYYDTDGKHSSYTLQTKIKFCPFCGAPLTPKKRQNRDCEI